MPSAGLPSAELPATEQLLSAEMPMAMQAQHTPAQTLRHAGGMVRISKGDQQRCIWPVHLSGWQQQGWTLIAAATGVQITPQPTGPAEVIEAPLAAATPEPSSSEPIPASTAAGEAASWELESSATGEALLLDDPLL